MGSKRRQSESMTLDQYGALMHAKVDEFAAMWRRENAKTPEDWPMEYDESGNVSPSDAWNEQFSAWMGWD